MIPYACLSALWTPLASAGTEISYLYEFRGVYRAPDQWIIPWVPIHPDPDEFCDWCDDYGCDDYDWDECAGPECAPAACDVYYDGHVNDHSYVYNLHVTENFFVNVHGDVHVHAFFVTLSV